MRPRPRRGLVVDGHSTAREGVMRLTITFATMASLAGFAACTSDRMPTNAEQGQPLKPLFDHVGGAVPPTVSVDVNNYVLQLRPNHLFNGFFEGTGTLFAGGLSYGNAPDAVVFHNTRGTGGPHLEGAGLPVEI